MDGLDSPAPVPMSGVRLDWQLLPPAVRAPMEAALGSPIVAGTNVTGGFSPAIAARLELADGRRVFVKAIDLHTNPDTPGMMRREAAVAAALPTTVPAPRLLWTHDADGWVVLLFEHVDGHQPASPWRTDELTTVIRAMERLAGDLTPSPITVPTVADKHVLEFSGWRQLAANPRARLDPWSRRHLDKLAAVEPRWVQATTGPSLLHSDLRADNMLIDATGAVWFVDWPHACRGAAWFDLVCMAPSVALQGGPDPEDLLAMSALTSAVDADDVTALVVALAGYFTERGAQPDPPGLPTVRAFQRAQGELTRQWVRRRTGWS